MEEVELKYEIIEEITAPSAVTPTEVIPAPPREVAYYIDDDMLPHISIYKSANAWWMDTRKLNKLLWHLKNGRLIKEAVVLVGITRAQWDYFNEVHPEFSSVKEACEVIHYNEAFRSMNNGIKKDANLAFRYLSKTHEKFKPEPKVEVTPVVQQTVNIVGNAEVIQHVDTTKIEDILTRAAERLFSNNGGEGINAGHSGQSVEEDSKE